MSADFPRHSVNSTAVTLPLTHCRTDFSLIVSSCMWKKNIYSLASRKISFRRDPRGYRARELCSDERISRLPY